MLKSSRSVVISSTVLVSFGLWSCNKPAKKAENKNTPNQVATKAPNPEQADSVAQTAVPTATETALDPAPMNPEGKTGSTAPVQMDQQVVQEPTTPVQNAPVSSADIPREVHNALLKFSYAFTPFKVTGFTPSPLETHVEGCVNKSILSATFSSPSSDKFTMSSPSSVDAEACVKKNTPSSVFWNFDFRNSFGASCNYTDWTIYNGKTFNDDQLALKLCSDATSGDVSYSASASLTEKTSPERVYKRTKQLSSSDGSGACKFTMSEGIRTYTDCIYVDRIDDGAGKSIHFLKVVLTGLKMRQGASSHVFSGNAKFTVDNWSGELKFGEFLKDFPWVASSGKESKNGMLMQEEPIKSSSPDQTSQTLPTQTAPAKTSPDQTSQSGSGSSTQPPAPAPAPAPAPSK